MHRLYALCASLLAGAFSAVEAADVYKCSRASGEVIYTDRPCPHDSRTVSIPQRALAAQSAGPSDSERRCVAVAEPLWSLQPLEAGGQLDAEQLQSIRDTRERLRVECAMRLAVSALAHECRERTLQVTAAVQRATDPRYGAELARVQVEYEERCNNKERDADILRHLRPLAPGES